MALSMDEQRILAEIERRLAAEDPGLASRLSSFRRPGPSVKLRTTRGMVIGSLLGIALIGAISILVFTMMPFRAHPRPMTSQAASSGPATSAEVRNGPAANSVAKPPTTAKSSAANSPTPNTATHP